MPGVGGNQERSTCRRTRSTRSTYKGTHTRMTQLTYKYKGTQKHTQHTQHTYKYDLRDTQAKAHAAHAAHAQARTPPLPSSSSFPAQPPLVASRRGLTSSPGKSSVVRGVAVAASRLPRGECSVVRGARWVAHVVSWKWKWYLVIFLVPKPPSLVLNRGEESV